MHYLERKSESILDKTNSTPASEPLGAGQGGTPPSYSGKHKVTKKYNEGKVLHVTGCAT